MSFLIIFKNNINCSVDGLKKSFVHQTKIVFENGEDNDYIVENDIETLVFEKSTI